MYGFSTQAGAAALITDGIAAILGKEYSNVEFVFLLLKPFKESQDTLITIAPADDRVLLISGEQPERHVHWYLGDLAESDQVSLERVILRPGPGLDRAVAEGQFLVWYDQVDIEADCVSEALARRASAERVVKTEQPRFRRRIYDGAVLALESLGVASAPGGFTGGLDWGGLDHCLTMALLIANLDRINEASAAVFTYLQAVYQHISVVEVIASKIIGSRQIDRVATLVEPGEPSLHQAHEVGLDLGRRTGRSLFLFCGGGGVGVTISHTCRGWEHYVEPCTLGQSQGLVGNGFRRVTTDEAAAIVAERDSDPGKQEAEIVVYLG